MENLKEKIKTGITAPKGFLASGISSGIKKDGNADIALLFSKTKSTAAGIFTLNKIRGHSLELSVKNIENGSARCVFINSGNANACLGPSGYKDAEKIAAQCAKELAIQPDEVLIGSTGVIGHPLPMEKVLTGISKVASALDPNGGHDAVKAIMTTDTFPKEASSSFTINGKTVTIGGMAKGSGMIHPNMATMISIITTDASVSSAFLGELLKKTADKSFNRISIDGDTSVCDMVLILANGLSGTEEIIPGTDAASHFEEALIKVSVSLAKKLASDGEGATKLIEVKVINAATSDDAHTAAKAIANSPLVKTAFFGEDANWGRILTAAGYSGAQFNPDKASIRIGEMLLFNEGVAIPFDEDTAKIVLKEKNISVNVDLGAGSYDTTVWTCDLSRDYIDINANYRT